LQKREHTMHRKTSPIVPAAAVLGLALITTSASAQWSVVKLHPEQVNASLSVIRGSSGNQQAGSILSETFQSRAALWTGSAESYVDLHPEGFNASFALANGDGQQGGSVTLGVHSIPGFWTATAASFVNLLPDVGPGPAQSGSVNAVAGGKQGGSVVQFPNSGSVASLWSGTAESWVNLNPAGATSSLISGMGGNQQAGRASFEGATDRAGYWTGTADSFVNVHPAHIPGIINSFLNDTDGVQQVGNIRVGEANGLRAAVWSGTADSVVDLHPESADRSFARAVSSGYQVGYIDIDFGNSFGNNAGIWNGTAESWVNLHDFLSADYISSEAEGIFVDGNTIFVSGTAYNAVETRFEAVMWVTVIPAPSSLPLLALAGLVGARRRRA